MFEWLKRAKPVAPVQEPSSGEGGFESLFGPRIKHTAERRPGMQTVLIIGNHLAETLAPNLAAHPVLASEFRFVAIAIHMVTLTDPAVQKQLAGAAFIFVQSNSAQHLAEIKAAAADDTVVMLYPDIVLRSLWPFDAQSGYKDAAVVESSTAVIRHPDGVLARLRTVEPDKQKRFVLYRDLAFEEAVTIERVASAQTRFLAQMDEQTEAGIGAWMAENFATKPLFYNSTHPSALVFQALAAFIWRKLGMAGRAPIFLGMDDWKAWSVPVHPGVARKLGVTWATETTRYRYTSLGEVTWEQWVRSYIDVLG